MSEHLPMGANKIRALTMLADLRLDTLGGRVGEETLRPCSPLGSC